MTAAAVLDTDQRLLVASAGPFYVAAFLSASGRRRSGLFPARPRSGSPTSRVLEQRPTWTGHTITATATTLTLTTATGDAVVSVTRGDLRRYRTTIPADLAARLARWRSSDPDIATAVWQALRLAPTPAEQTLLPLP